MTFRVKNQCSESLRELLKLKSWLTKPGENVHPCIPDKILWRRKPSFVVRMNCLHPWKNRLSWSVPHIALAAVLNFKHQGVVFLSYIMCLWIRTWDLRNILQLFSLTQVSPLEKRLMCRRPRSEVFLREQFRLVQKVPLQVFSQDVKLVTDAWYILTWNLCVRRATF